MCKGGQASSGFLLSVPPSVQGRPDIPPANGYLQHPRKGVGFKFWDSGIAEMTCNAPDYPEVAGRSIREMYRQVGDLVLDEKGVAQRGLLVRHLVLPDGRAGTREIMRFISQEISTATYVNIMSQYRPCGNLAGIKWLKRSVSRSEFADALSVAKAEGITRLN